MGIEDLPEVKLARRIINKHSLNVPIDLDKIVQEYAKLIYRRIPISGVDGVSINLKVPGKKPTIIVNSGLPKTRQLFTLAHEFGHIIIPWHLGTIVDDLYSESYKDFSYSLLEQEANRFAAELLMPKDWILSEFKAKKNDLASLHKHTVRHIGVSDQAAAIRLIETLPANIIYTAEEFGKVSHSGKTARTNAFPQEAGNKFVADPYPYIDSYTVYDAGLVNYHWWKLTDSVNIEAEDKRTWREILDDIAQDIEPDEGVSQFKKTINGIMAHAHGKTKREEDFTVDKVISACIYRLRRPDLKEFTSHPDFEKFVKIRVLDFFKPK